MSKKKNNFYVVWIGNNPGIYNSWEACKKEIHGFEGAKYKGYKTREQAEQAFQKPPEESVGKKELSEIDMSLFERPGGPLADSFAVDAACSGNPGKMEYRGVYTISGTEIFRQGPYLDATNNIGEFLALVHVLTWQKQKNLNKPVYSDSRIAIGWIKNKKCNTKLIKTPDNSKVFELITRAETWLRTNTYTIKILKWETSEWGEITADFGRK